jgi:hypothetical protein
MPLLEADIGDDQDQESDGKQPANMVAILCDHFDEFRFL